ncbi:MAG: hypothetical protein ACXWJK_14320 [Burkholderiaceae bacterium]
MKKQLKHFHLILLLSIIFPPVLYAQMATNAPVVKANTAAAKTAQAGQAPDEVVKKLSNLVHAAKYDEAQQLIRGLLIAYPNDQRLIQAESLVDKLVASAKQGDSASGGSQPTNSIAQPAVSATPGQLTGMDKVEFNSLIEMAKEAEQNPNLEQQKASLIQFMNESRTFLLKYPDQVILWKFRALISLSLDQPDAGYEAGQKLLDAGAADSNDPTLQQLISQLKIKGWLNKEGVEKAKQKIEEDKKYSWLIGTWTGTQSWFSKAAFDYGQKQNIIKDEFIKSAPGHGVMGFAFNANDVRNNTPSFNYTVLNLEEMSLSTNWKVNLHAPDPDWQPITSFALSSDKRTITIVWMKHTFVLTKVSD